MKSHLTLLSITFFLSFFFLFLFFLIFSEDQPLFRVKESSEFKKNDTLRPRAPLLRKTLYSLPYLKYFLTIPNLK